MRTITTTPAPVLLSAGERAHGQCLTLPGRAGTLSAVRASGGEGRTSAGEICMEARTNVDEPKDDVEARIRKGEDAVEPHDKDADSNSKPYHRHQKCNLTSSTSSRASSAMSGRLTTLDDNVIPPWLNACGQLRRQVSDRCPYPEEQPPTPTPIPVGHPYNLPPPAAPSTPRTTRRQMLQTEMSESLRRNLLWERQVSKVNLVGYRASTNGGSRGNVLGGLKPLTTTPSMVQLRAKGEAAGNGNGAAGPSGADTTQPSDRERRGSGGEAEEREERRRLAMARNKSWADDYHFKGW